MSREASKERQPYSCLGAKGQCINYSVRFDRIKNLSQRSRRIKWRDYPYVARQACHCMSSSAGVIGNFALQGNRGQGEIGVSVVIIEVMDQNKDQNKIQ